MQTTSSSAGFVDDIEVAGSNSDTKVTPLNQLVQLVFSNGEHSKLIQGCFENHLLGRGLRLEKLAGVYEMVTFFDELERRVASHQDFTLMQYSPFVVASFFLSFCSNDRRPIRFPRFLAFFFDLCLN